MNALTEGLIIILWFMCHILIFMNAYCILFLSKYIASQESMPKFLIFTFKFRFLPNFAL